MPTDQEFCEMIIRKNTNCMKLIYKINLLFTVLDVVWILSDKWEPVLSKPVEK